MIENIRNLIIEHLRGLRASLNTVEGKIDTLTLRVGSLEHVAGLRRDLALIHGDIAATNQRLDHHEQRLERIEKRLDSSADSSPAQFGWSRYPASAAMESPTATAASRMPEASRRAIRRFGAARPRPGIGLGAFTA